MLKTSKAVSSLACKISSRFYCAGRIDTLAWSHTCAQYVHMINGTSGVFVSPFDKQYKIVLICFVQLDSS